MDANATKAREYNEQSEFPSGVTDRFRSLLHQVELDVLQAQNLSRDELIVCLQNAYGTCLQISQLIDEQYLSDPSNTPTPHYGMIQSMRHLMLNQQVTEMRQQGWYLEAVKRKLKKGGESIYWRMRRRLKGGKRETRYIGVVVSGRC